MVQFTLKQLLLAMACFSIGFAGVAMTYKGYTNGWGWVARFYVAESGFVCGLGVLRGDFWRYLLVAIVGPVLVILAFGMIALAGFLIG